MHRLLFICICAMVLHLGATYSHGAMYTYTDKAGETHMVDSLDKIPEEYRTATQKSQYSRGTDGYQPESASVGDSREAGVAEDPTSWVKYEEAYAELPWHRKLLIQYKMGRRYAQGITVGSKYYMALNIAIMLVLLIIVAFKVQGPALKLGLMSIIIAATCISMASAYVQSNVKQGGTIVDMLIKSGGPVQSPSLKAAQQAGLVEAKDAVTDEKARRDFLRQMMSQK